MISNIYAHRKVIKDCFNFLHQNDIQSHQTDSTTFTIIIETMPISNFNY